jgi:hypothetical protein
MPQPFLHALATSLAAPTQVLSDPAGDILSSAEGPGAQGVIHADVRVVSDLRVTVDGRPVEHIATTVEGDRTTFTGLVRRLVGRRTRETETQLRVDRNRRVGPGELSEELAFSSTLTEPVTVEVEVAMSSDFAPIESVKVGRGSVPVALGTTVSGEQVTWESGPVAAGLTAPGATVDASDPLVLRLGWQVTIPARGRTGVGWKMQITDKGSAVVAARTPGLDVSRIVSEMSDSVSRAGVHESRLGRWLQRSLDDLNGLRMTTAEDRSNTFFAAGSPWYLTLFGRDALWTSRLLLPVDVDQAGGTLGALARLAGTRSDVDSAESPGKIMHELRRGQFAFTDTTLPPLYFGTIDATPLWICLLHDAWRAGLDDRVVTELLPTLQAALRWLADFGDADDDGFLEYLDESGRGLANQGWKDSGDSVRFADGTIAEGPVALCEVQGYAFEAATSGAALLDAFGLDGGDEHRAWAGELARRFRAQFWCEDETGPYPALALDGRKQRVDSVTSNIGHLLGTGILNAEEERLVAQRVTAEDMDSGLGLRTLSAASVAYSPLSYHCGSVWPHDTAIVVAGLVRAGLADHAGGLVEGLLRASMAFDQRLPELWSGEGRPVPYPAACRPQAWSAAAAVTVADALRRFTSPALEE